MKDVALEPTQNVNTLSFGSPCVFPLVREALQDHNQQRYRLHNVHVIPHEERLS